MSPLWLFVPEVSDHDLKEAVAYDAKGLPVTLDMRNPPDRPVITIARDEHSFLKVASVGNRIDEVMLRDLSATAAEPATGGDTTYGEQLTTVGFKDVQEPWVKGDAEVYAIVTYIDRDGVGHSEIVPLEGVIAANTIYHPGKILHYWLDNKFQIVDIAFYEHDSQYNYKELSRILLDAAATVTLAAHPEAGVPINLIKTVMQAVLAALPDDTFTDSDDYLDVINTIQKYADEKKLLLTGVSNNFAGTFSTFGVKFSDE